MTATAYQSLIEHLTHCQKATQISELLDALLTDKEKQDIANRIRIFDLLEQGVTQREISEQLGVGIATVSRGAKAIQSHDISALLATLRSN